MTESLKQIEIIDFSAVHPDWRFGFGGQSFTPEDIAKAITYYLKHTGTWPNSNREVITKEPRAVAGGCTMDEAGPCAPGGHP